MCALCCLGLKLFLTYKGEEEEHINAVLGTVVPLNRVSNLDLHLSGPRYATLRPLGRFRTLDKQLNRKVHDEVYVLK